MGRGPSSPHTCDVDEAIAAVGEQHAEVTRQAEARQRVHQTARSIADRVHGKPSTAERLVTWWDARQPAVMVGFVALLVATLGGPLLGFAVDWVAVALLDDGCTIETATAAIGRAEGERIDPHAVAVALRNSSN